MTTNDSKDSTMHEILQRLQNLESENKQLKEKNQQLEQRLEYQSGGVIQGSVSSMSGSSSISEMTDKVETPRDNQRNHEGKKSGGHRTITGTAPLIVFVGPPRCGKSQVMMSLIEHLKRSTKPRYSFEADDNYASDDSNYGESCSDFTSVLSRNVNCGDNEKYALPGSVNEVLVNINEDTTFKCRMLEAPGEDFFKYKDGKVAELPRYMQQILYYNKGRRYPVYYIMLLNLYKLNEKTNRHLLENSQIIKDYQGRLLDLFDKGYSKDKGDKIILLFNKSDEFTQNNETPETYVFSFYDQIKSAFRTGGMVKSSAYKYMEFTSGDYFFDDPDDEGVVLKRYDFSDSAKACAAKLWDLLNKKWYTM